MNTCLLLITIVLLATLGSNAQTIADTENHTSTNKYNSYVTYFYTNEEMPAFPTPKTYDVIVEFAPIVPRQPTTTPAVKPEEIECGVAPRFQNIGSATRRQTTRRHKRVVNGRNAGYGEHPWTASIIKKQLYRGGFGLSEICGASLISSTYLITAAHCVEGLTLTDSESLFVRVGNHNSMLNEGTEQMRKIGKITIHAQYNRPALSFDIAVLKLDEPVQFTDYVQPVCLPSSNDADLVEGTLTTALGFGATTEFGGRMTQILKRVHLPVLSNNICSLHYPYLTANTVICAGLGTGKAVCPGDSGGPLVWRNPVDSKWYLRGVSNFSTRRCGSQPSGFANVKWYIEWIKSIIQ